MDATIAYNYVNKDSISQFQAKMIYYLQGSNSVWRQKYQDEVLFRCIFISASQQSLHGLFKCNIIIMSKAQDDTKLSLDEEISLIFKSVYQRQVQLKPKTFFLIRDFMKYNAQELVCDALKRAVRRDASLSTLEVGDLLWAIERRGEKYKLKIGKSLVTANNFSEFGEKKMMINYNDEEGEQLDDDNEK